jgi:hypothetical protein
MAGEVKIGRIPAFQVSVVTIGSSSASAIPAHSNMNFRDWVVIKNNHASAKVYVSHLETVTGATNGYLLGPGEELPPIHLGQNDKIYAIADSSNVPVAIIEHARMPKE